VAFVRAIAHDGDDTDPVATCQGKFMATGQRFNFDQSVPTNKAEATRE